MRPSILLDVCRASSVRESCVRSMSGRACDSPFFFLTSVHASNYIVGRVSRIVPAGDVRAFHDWTCVRLSTALVFFFFIHWKQETMVFFFLAFDVPR